MPEKRFLKRYRKRLQVRFGVERPESLGFTEDISTEGMFIKSTHILPPGTRLKINISTHANGVINVEGVVRWAKKVQPSLIHYAKSGMGVKITKMISGEEAYSSILSEV